MDNAQKAIMIGVGLFITIIIIAAVMLITGMGQDLLNSGTNKLSNVSSQLQSQLTSDYDYKQLSGAQVLAAVKSYYSEPELIVCVNNVKGGVTGNDVWTTPRMLDGTRTSPDGTKNRVIVTIGTKESTTQPAQGSFTSSASTDSKNRIVTTAQYRSYLIELNGSVLGIYFERM